MPRAISKDDIYIHISANEKECASEVSAKVLALLNQEKKRRITFDANATLTGVYEQIVKQSRRESVDWSFVECFELSEFSRQPKNLYEQLVRPLFLSDSRIHFFDTGANDPVLETKRYDLLLHNIDLTVLSLGIGGELGLNAPGSSFDSRTRVVHLTEATESSEMETPTRGFTQGMANILESNHIFLIAMGEESGLLVSQFFAQPVSEQFPASILRTVGKKVTLFLDEAAAKGIGRSL